MAGTRHAKAVMEEEYQAGTTLHKAIGEMMGDGNQHRRQHGNNLVFDMRDWMKIVYSAWRLDYGTYVFVTCGWRKGLSILRLNSIGYGKKKKE
jgi:hypothetical protein